MKVLLIALLAFVLILGLGASASPVFAAAGRCTAEPASGPPGTVFKISCSGLAPNQIANTYVVEPDGRAMDGGDMSPFGTSPNNPKADKDGNVSFVFETADSHFASAQLGTWVIVADNPRGASSAVSVRLTANPFPTSGGSLTFTTKDHRSFVFLGEGFAPKEVVDVWLTLPFNCSGTSGSFFTDSPDSDRTAIGAVDPSDFNTSLGWDSPGDHPRADEKGGFVFTLNFRTYACTGIYTLTARALGSGQGAQVAFEVKGNSVIQDGHSLISVIVGPFSNTLVPFLTVNGKGFGNGGVVTCWATRPDGRAITFGNAKVSTGGTFSVSGFAEDTDVTEGGSDFPSESAEPGFWKMTCATADRVFLATADFKINGLPLDP